MANAACVLVLLVAGVVATGCTQEQDAPTPPPTVVSTAPVSSPTTAPTPTGTVPAGLKRHFQPASHVTDAFQFSYPEDWTILAPQVLPDQQGLSIVLWSPAASQESKEFPRAATKVDISVAPIAADFGCNLDERGASVREEALGGRTGLELHPPPSDFDFGTGTIREVVIVTVKVGKFEYCAVGMFGQDASEEAFRSLVASFEVFN